MLVSVVIPTYKRSTRLPIAIDSVLKQTYSPIEIIVVDDNNDDDFRAATKKTLAPYINNKQITYIPHTHNQGGCAARNTGAKQANGAYLAFLDDDDFYEPEKIAAQMAVLTQASELDACMCSMYRIDEQDNRIESRENMARGTTLKDAILDGNVFTSMLLIKTAVFNNLGGFSEIPRFQDKYFHYKFLAHKHHIAVLDTPLLTLVEHQEFRISLSAHKKIIDALNTLRRFENQQQALFSKKEWRYITERYYYNKAYTLCQGTLTNKLQALKNGLQSLAYYTGKCNTKKVLIKACLPNFVFKKTP